MRIYRSTKNPVDSSKTSTFGEEMPKPKKIKTPVVIKTYDEKNKADADSVTEEQNITTVAAEKTATSVLDILQNTVSSEETTTTAPTDSVC